MFSDLRAWADATLLVAKAGESVTLEPDEAEWLANQVIALTRKASPPIQPESRSWT